MMIEADPNAGSLAIQSNEPLTVTVAGREFSLRPLRNTDFAAAQKHIVASRLNQFLDVVKLRPMPDDVKAKAIAGIMTETPTLDQVFLDVEGRLFLLARSTQHGKDGVDLKALRNGLTDCDLLALHTVVLQVSGLIGSAKDGDDPLASNSKPSAETSESA